MKKILIVIAVCFIFFAIEFLLFNFLGSWFKPDLLLLLIIFFNLSSGIRYSLVAAVVGGVIQDSFSLAPFGAYLFTYIACAFLTTIVRRYLFHASPYTVRILLALIITTVQALILYVINSMTSAVEPIDFLISILLPEVLITTLAVNFIFRHLKQCVLKFSA